MTTAPIPTPTLRNGLQGSCTLVGAGPGDPELLTLRAVRAIESATVLLVDDLVSEAIVALAPRTASIQHAYGLTDEETARGRYGWGEAHSYDPCGAVNPPPYFPTTGRFIESRYKEDGPLGSE